MQHSIASHKYPTTVSKSISVILSCSRGRTFIFPAYTFFPRGYLGVWYSSVNAKEPEFFLNAGCRHAAFSGLHSTESKIVTRIPWKHLLFCDPEAGLLWSEEIFIWMLKPCQEPLDYRNSFLCIHFSRCFDIVWWIHSFWARSFRGKYSHLDSVSNIKA